MQEQNASGGSKSRPAPAAPSKMDRPPADKMVTPGKTKGGVVTK